MVAIAVPTKPKTTAAPVAFKISELANDMLKQPEKVSTINAGIAFNESDTAAICKEGMCSKFFETIFTLKP